MKVAGSHGIPRRKYIGRMIHTLTLNMIFSSWIGGAKKNTNSLNSGVVKFRMISSTIWDLCAVGLVFVLGNPVGEIFRMQRKTDFSHIYLESIPIGPWDRMGQVYLPTFG